jgi:hypothetical protein
MSITFFGCAFLSCILLAVGQQPFRRFIAGHSTISR